MQEEDKDEIVIHRPTGPRLTLADPVSRGELVAYNAGRATRSVAKAVSHSVKTASSWVKDHSKSVAVHVGLAAALFVGIDKIAVVISASHVALAILPSFNYHSLPFSRDANGWSVLTPVPTTSGSCGSASPTSDGSCIWYVSSTGTDDNSHCIGYAPPVTSTPTTTCLTAAFALTKIRSGKADWLLLKRGETFTNLGGRNLLGIAMGQNAQKPFVFSAYPQDPSTYDDRPIVDLAGATPNGGTFIQQQAGSASAAFTSIRFTNTNLDPNSVNYWGSPRATGTLLRFLPTVATFLLIEDCEFNYTATGIQVQAPNNGIGNSNDLIFRRNVFYNDSAPTLAPILLDFFNSVTIEENLIYKNYTTRSSATITVSITAATPAVITYPFDSTVAPENGGLPPSFGTAPLVGLGGTLPTGLSATSSACQSQDSATQGATQCVYLCNVSGNTANLSRSAACSSLISTTGSDSSTATSVYSNFAGNKYNHGIYLGIGWDQALGANSTGGGLVFRNNISAYQPATGAQSRPGGRMIYDNLFLKNSIAITCCGWPTEISYNVILQGVDRPEKPVAVGQGWGIEVSSYSCAAPASGYCTQDRVDNPTTPGAVGSTIHHNILAKSEGTGGIGIRLHDAEFYNVGLGANIKAVTGVSVTSNIICDWNLASATSGKPYLDVPGGNTVNNTNLPDPTTNNIAVTCASLGLTPSTVGNYYDTIGGGGGSSTDNFLDAARAKWTKISWDPRYLASAVNAYIRPSYGIANP